MRRSVISLISCLLVTMLYANPVTLEQARQTAADFLASQSKGGRRAPAQIVSQQTVLNAVDASGNPYLYAFNTGGNAGYVIVSGDDRFREVLGYSSSGKFDEQNMPCNMRAWLQGYVDEMERLNAMGYQPVNSTQRRALKAPIEPLIKTKWDQDAPYNNLCQNYFKYGDAVTGCVATAMAQVMYYHAKKNGLQETATAATIPAYTTDFGYPVPAVPAGTTINWNDMALTYSSNAQPDAVATLMLCCGTSVQMSYGNATNGGSSASSADIPKALKTYFGYDATTQYVSRSSYSLSDWTNLIYAELAAERPVLFGAQSSKGGHEFIIDGYDGDELFHVNWGWSGANDDYYALSVLSPHHNDGIGASGSNDGYSIGQDAIIGVQIGSGGSGVNTPIMLTTSVFTPIGTSIRYEASNYTGEAHNFRFGIGYIDDNGAITPINTSSGYLKMGYGFINDYAIIFDLAYSNHPSGKYSGSFKIVPISKEYSSSTWLTDVDPNVTYVTATFDSSNQSVTLTPSYNLSATIEFSGSKCATESQPVDVTISNSGCEFYGWLYMFVSTDENNKGSVVDKGGITIQGGKSASMSFEWTPQTEGIYHIWITTDPNGVNVVETAQVTINAGTGLAVGPFIFSELIPVNADESSMTRDSEGHIVTDILSNSLSFTSAKVVNISNVAQSSVTLQFRLYKYVNNSWSFVNSLGAQVSADAGKSINFGSSLSYENVGYGTYLLKIRTNNDISDERYVFNLTKGYKKYDVNGELSWVKTSDTTVNVGDDVAAVDLSDFNFEVINPNNNPNTLYILGNKEVPEELTGKNVVQNGVATQITLTDGYAFCSPIDFEAENISYTRTETSYYDKNQKTGWTTIVLPFAATGIKTFVGDKKYDLEWFLSASDTNKNLWLMEFSDEVNNVAEFGYVMNMEANKPYIMALPGDSYGNKWSLEGLPIIFYATNADIKGNAKAATTGTNYKFKGTTVFTGEQNNIYKLNDKGNSFDKGTGTASVDPFRAYFEPTTTAALATSLAIGFVEGDNTTAIQTIDDSIPSVINGATEWFTLDGRRLNEKPTAKGIYILNGKKVVVK